jgi:O-antigen/teichoic acid export membrane protein
MIARARVLYAEPLTRSASTLMANTMVTSMLGLVFWLVAARMYTSTVVGEDGALLSSLLVLSAVCQLDLGNIMVRFLPVAQRRIARMVGGAYALTVTVSLLTAVAFVLLGPRWSSALGFIREDDSLAFAFCVLAALWGVFALQDYVMTALHLTPWIVAENTIFGLAKLALLPALMVAGFTHGVFLAWLGPVVALVVAVNALLFRRVISRRTVFSETRGVDEYLVRPGPVLRFARYDYLATILNQGATWVMPVLVLILLGTKSSAYFYIAFTIVVAFDLLFVNVGMALVVEGAVDEHRLAALTGQAVRRFVGFLLIGGVCAAAAAPVIMLPFGREYVDGAAPVLRLLVLASACRATIALFAAVARVRRRTSWLVVVHAGLATLLIALTIVLGGRGGLTGVALAWLVAHATVAAAVMFPMRRLLRSSAASTIHPATPLGVDAVAAAPPADQRA